jgi:fructokinase
LLELKEKYDFALAFNPGQHNIKEDADLILQATAQSDVLLLNKDEAIELILKTQKEISRERLDDEKFLLQALKNSGAGIIGMTDGKRGAWSFDGKEYWHCPIHTSNGLVDSTGAGDAFGSGFFSALLEEKPIDYALRYGIANSGSVIGAYGAIVGLLTKNEMEGVIGKIIPERLN